MYLSPGLAEYEIRSLRLLIAVLKRYQRRYGRYGFAASLPGRSSFRARPMGEHAGPVREERGGHTSLASHVPPPFGT